MGKTLDELNLSDEPLRRAQPTDVRDTAWYQFAQEIEALLATGTVDWAEDTLTSIKESVEQYCTVTDGQRRAVRNIELAGQRRGQRRGEGLRRYEGWGRRYR